MASAVIDANLGVALVTPLPYSKTADRCLSALEADSIELIAPSLWEYEILSALRRSVYANHLDTLS